MASAKILTLCDALVSQIQSAWAPSAPNSVSRLYLAPVSTAELSSLSGRQVYLFPGTYSNDPETRLEDRWSYEVGVLVVERYSDAGPPTAAWMDTRVDFVEGTIASAIDFDGRGLLAIGSRRIWTETIETLTYDLEMLNQKNLFWSELTVTFKEVTS